MAVKAASKAVCSRTKSVEAAGLDVEQSKPSASEVATMPESDSAIAEQSRPSASERSYETRERQRDLAVEQSRPSASDDAGERQRDM